MEGLYTIGMGILLFLSGLDTDFTVLGKHKKEIHIYILVD